MRTRYILFTVAAAFAMAVTESLAQQNTIQLRQPGNTTVLQANAGPGSFVLTMPATSGTLLVSSGGSLALGSPGPTPNNTAGQLVFWDGTDPGQTVTIGVATQAANRAYTIPDAGASAAFVLTEGTQTINGALTLAGAITINTAGNGFSIANTTGLNVAADGSVSDATSALELNDELVVTGGPSSTLNVNSSGFSAGYDDGTAVSNIAADGTIIELAHSDDGGTNTHVVSIDNAGVSLLSTNGGVFVDAATNVRLTAGEAIDLDGAVIVNARADGGPSAVVGATDYIVVLTTGATDVALPTGSEGRVLRIKNASGATVTVTPDGADTSDVASIGDGVAVELVFIGTNWYQVGN